MCVCEKRRYVTNENRRTAGPVPTMAIFGCDVENEEMKLFVFDENLKIFDLRQCLRTIIIFLRFVVIHVIFEFCKFETV